MTVYAVVKQPNPDDSKLVAAIATKFPGKHYQLDGDVGWLVAAKHTAQELSDELGISDGSTGAALVFEVGSYFGRANPNIWTWIRINWEAS